MSTPTTPFETGQAVTGPRCPSVTCQSRNVYFVRVSENPEIAWFQCDAADCPMDGPFDAYLTGVRARPTGTLPAPETPGRRFKVGDKAIYRGLDRRRHGETVEIITPVDRTGRCKIKFENGHTVPNVDERGLARAENPVTITFNEDEYETVQTLAELADLSVPEFLRNAALAAHVGYVERMADATARADRAERHLMEITTLVKRITDGAR